MYCDEILRYSYLHYIFLYCLQLIKYLWCPFEHVLDNASNAQTLCKIKIQDFTRSFPMSKIFVVFLSSFATGQTRCYGGCGGETPHWACFSREICNFTQQNGEASLIYVCCLCKIRCSTCIALGQQAMIRSGKKHSNMAIPSVSVIAKRKIICARPTKVDCLNFTIKEINF